MIKGATLNGIRATSAKASIPAWGCWYADVSLDGEHTLAGDATLVMADLTLVGTVLSGGPQMGRSTYRIVGGKGGWGRTLPKKSYANDAGVKLSTVIEDAAREAGETLGPLPTTRVGSSYVRQSEQDGRQVPASRVLQDLASRAWYVDEAGVTQLGARPTSELVGAVTRVQPLDKARGKIVLASEQIATILPGVVVDGITAVDVSHEVSSEGGLRSTLWGSQTPSSLDSFRTILEQLDPDRAYRGVTEYRIVTISGTRLNLQPVRVATGMPELERVPVWPGVPGCTVIPELGSSVMVGFVDSDPARPYVASFASDSASEGLSLTTDGIGAAGHAVTLEQVLGLFAQYTAARFSLSDLGTGYQPVYSAAPPAALATLIGLMITGAVTPGPVGPTPGAVLDALGLPALIEAALAIQLPDPASAGLPTPVMPGLGKKNFRL